MNIIRYYVSPNSSSLRHWTVRAVAVDEAGREYQHFKTFFKGIKRDCKAEAVRLNRKLKSK